MDKNMTSEVLRVGILPLGGLYILNIKPDGAVQIVDGYEKRFLETVLQGLHMIYTVVSSVDGKTGSRLTNGSWTGLTGMIQRNEIDLAFGSLTVTGDRLEVAKFSYPYRDRFYPFATKMPPYVQTYRALIKPFSLKVWIALLTTILLLPLPFRLLSRDKKGHDRYIPTLFKILSILLQESPKIHASSPGETILFASWILVSALLSCAFLSLVLASLSVPVRKKGVETIQDLSEAIEAGTFSCATSKLASFLVKALAESPYRHHNIIADHMVKNNNFLDLKFDVFAKYIAVENRAVILPSDFSDLMFHGVLVSKDTFETVSIAIATTKSFKYSKLLDKVIHRVWASGIYLKSREDLFFRQKDAILKKKRVEEGRQSLDLKDLIAPFTILISGHLLGIVVLLLEIIDHKSNKSKCMKI